MSSKKQIVLLTDYKGNFGSKYIAKPYRSGMDTNLLISYFKKSGYDVILKGFHEIDFRSADILDYIYLYTSSEDHEEYYKYFIQDIVLGLEISGAKVIPEYKCLHAHHNKVFMEILRDASPVKEFKNIKSKYFGTIEALKKELSKIDEKVVLKPSAGAMSKGVQLAKSKNDILNCAKPISKTKNILHDLWDLGRSFKHKNYIKESRYRKKFVIQNFIGSLDYDFKVLIYHNKYYVLKRYNRKNDFRASGGGKLVYEMNLPEGLLDFSHKCFKSYNVPNISLDIAFDGSEFYLFEFQFIYYGTYTIDFSEFYFKKEDSSWRLIKEKSILEEEFANSVIKYLDKS